MIPTILPVELNFDLNDGCNLTCVMCGGRRKPSEQQFIPQQEFRQKILSLFKHVTAFQFGCQCEPLLLPYFADAVRQIDETASAETEGVLVSNGTLLTDAISKLLLGTQVFKRLRFSWDASHRELFQQIRRGADFDRLLENMKHLIMLRNTTGSLISIEFNVTILPENIQDLPAIIQLAGFLGINRVTTNKLFPNDQKYVSDSYARLLIDRMNQAAAVAATLGVSFEGQSYRTERQYLEQAASLETNTPDGYCLYSQTPRLALVLDPSGSIHSPCRKITHTLANLLYDNLPVMIDNGLTDLLTPVFETTDERCFSCHLLKVTPGADLAIHFFTIILNGEPFIRHHIDVFTQLSFNWHWHIVEGVADLVHDTAWSLAGGGRIPDEFHAGGLSNDGTTAYLDELKLRFPDQITIYRKPDGAFWDGKLEMVNAPLAAVREECLLWQVDSDELWSPEAITALHGLFTLHPERSAAYCYCDYFVGPRKYVSSLNTWATRAAEWLRVWQFTPGMRWAAHEPPILVDQDGRNVAARSPFSRDETVLAGVTFQHFAYALEEQVRFKESYYGYREAVACWQRLQQTTGPVKAADYLPWALPDAVVDDWPADAAHHLAERFLPPPTVTRYVSMSVHGATRFEHELRRLFAAICPVTVIETGTFLGRGTTSIIWHACRDLGLNTDITTIEVNPEHHRQACDYFKANGMEIRAEMGLSIPRTKLPDLAEINETFVIKADDCGGRIYYDHDEAERAQRYYHETAFNVPDDLLGQALARCAYRPDFVLLDSAGHIGLAEFRHLLELLRGDCYLMLDDINHCKHAATMQEIHRDPRFEILVESDEKFGFSVTRYRYVKQLIYLRTDAIGDNVLSAGILPYLKEHYPGASLTVVCQDRVASLYDACPVVDGVISFNYIRLMTKSSYRKLIIDKINSVHPTLLINPIYSHDLHDEFLAHHCQAPIKISYQGDTSNRSQEKLDATQHLYSLTVPNNPDDLTELDRHSSFLRGIGIAPSLMQPRVWTSGADEAWAEDFMKQHAIEAGQAIMLFPGALLDCKTYPHYVEVIAELQDVPLLVLGGEELRQRADELCLAHGGNAVNLTGQTSLGQMAALMRHGKIYLGADSAGLHIACAVGLRNVVLLGGAHFGRFCPYSPLTTVVCLPLDCYGCNWQCHHKRVHCLHDIRPATVLNAVRKALQDNTIVKKPRLHLQQNAQPDTPPVLTGESLTTGLFLDRFQLSS